MDFNFSHLMCFSPTHSSHLIGEVIMNALQMEHSAEIDLTYEKPAGPVYLQGSVTVIALPVYGGRIPETALERMEGIQGKEALAIPVVVYGNRDYDDALLELKDWCVAHGFTPIAAAAFVGEHSYSRNDRPIAAHRPDEKDLDIARQFGAEVRQWIREWKEGTPFPPLMVKGNFPYKVKGPKSPQTPLTKTEWCTHCGLCIEICPVQAISLKEEIVSDAGRCIKCCACVKQCPAEARIFDTPYTDLLFKNFSARREPELFIP